MSERMSDMKLLTLSTLYPNLAQPRNGIFIQHRIRNLIAAHPAEVRVVAPVPWFPLKSDMFGKYGVLAQVPRRDLCHGIPTSRWTRVSIGRLVQRNFRKRWNDSFTFSTDSSRLAYSMMGLICKLGLNAQDEEACS